MAHWTEGCCVNLGPRGRLERWAEAVAALVTAAVLLVVCAQPYPWVRTLAVVLVTLAVFCGLQAGHRTCAILAFAGRRNLDHGSQPVHDRTERRILRRRAWTIVAQSVAVGVLATIYAAFA